MGSTADIWRLQSCGLGLFCYMLCLVPGPVSETQEICHSVSLRRHHLHIETRKYQTFMVERSVVASTDSPTQHKCCCSTVSPCTKVRTKALLIQDSRDSSWNGRLEGYSCFDIWPLLLTHASISRWSVGSVLFLSSWAVLMGPLQYAQHLISGSRLPFTAAYFGSIFLTIYFAVGVSLLLFSYRFSHSSRLSSPCNLNYGIQSFHVHQSFKWSSSTNQKVEMSHMPGYLTGLRASKQLLIKPLPAAPLDHPHSDIINLSACSLDMVLGQLLPHGRHRFTFCSSFGRQSSGSMDE